MIFQTPFTYLSSQLFRHYQDSSDRKLRYQQPRVQITTFILLILAYAVYVLTAKIAISPLLPTIISTAPPLLFVLLGSRAASQVLDVLCAFLSIFTPLMITQFQDNIFVSFISVSLGPVFTLLITNNYRCFFMSMIIYLINFNTNFKDQLLDVLITLDRSQIEGFINQAFLTVSVQIIISMIIYGVMNLICQNCIIEMNKKDQSVEQAKINNLKLFEDISEYILNPLRHLYANNDFFLSHDTSSTSHRGHDTLKRIQTSIKLFRNEISNLLMHEKLKLEDLKVQPTPTRTSDWLSEIWTIASDLLKDKGTAGFLKVQRKVPSLLYIDSVKVQQVILNLLQFAISTTHKGAIHLTIEWMDLENVSDRCFEPVPYNYDEEGVFEKKEALHILDIHNTEKGLERFQVFKGHEREIKFASCNYSQRICFGTLKVTVWNTGDGFNEKDLQKLFDEDLDQAMNMNDRIESIRKRSLHVSRNMCRKIDGDIRAYSMKDVGTTVVACIPLPMYSSYHTTVGMRAKMTKLRRRKLKVMMGNNDPTFSHKALNYLNSLEAYMIEKASSVSDFFVNFAEMIQESRKPVDLVLIDLSLLHLDLAGLCERVRIQEKKEQIGPLYIIVTGDIEPNDKIKALLNKEHPGHVNAYLRRPFEFGEFLEILINLEW